MEGEARFEVLACWCLTKLRLECGVEWSIHYADFEPRLCRV